MYFVRNGVIVLLNYLKRWLGFEKQSQYVKNYFFRSNMTASIYMSLVYIVIEIWMIIRLTYIIIRDDLYSDLE